MRKATGIRATNIGKEIYLRVDSFGREIGILAGEEAIYIDVEDVPKLIEELKNLYEEVVGVASK